MSHLFDDDINERDKQFEDEDYFLENQEPITSDQLSRRDVRSMIFHLLYAMEAFDYQESLEAILDNFNRGFNMDLKKTDQVFVIAQAILAKQDALDEIYKPLLDNWRFDRIGIPTKLILRLAVWELSETDMDHRIVINEAVELAKCFAEKDSFKFINGILDKISKQVSPGESK